MKLYELAPAPGANVDVYRKGRGHGSGNGKTSGKGHKGQKARSGGSIRPGFEGGQMPLQRQIPKRGFVNIFATRYAVINVEDLEVFENGAVVDLEAVMEAKLVKKALDGLKVLGRGELNVALTVKASKFSKSAVKAIEAAGGKTEVI